MNSSIMNNSCNICLIIKNRVDIHRRTNWIVLLTEEGDYNLQKKKKYVIERVGILFCGREKIEKFEGISFTKAET